MRSPTTRTLFLAVASILLTLPAHAQPRPDFSGTWKMDEPRSESAHYAEFVGPVSLIIKQSDDEMTIESHHGDRTTTAVYKLYESEKTATAAPAMLPAFRAYWVGSTLVSETLRNVSESTVRTKEIRWLSADGQEMTVQTTLIVEHGYTLSGTKNYGTGKDVFKKVGS